MPAIHAQQFQQPSVIATPAAPYSSQPVWATSFVSGDLDGDGKIDFLYRFVGSGSYAGYVLDSPLFNNGGGVFVPGGGGTGAEYVPGSSVVESIAPVTANGRPVEITVQGAPGYATVLTIPYSTGRMDGTQVTDSNFAYQGAQTPNFNYMVAADLNGDSVNDVVVEDAANNYLYVLLNDGTGNFKLKGQYALSVADGTGPIIAGDFNHDGKTDILIVNSTSHVVTIYNGNGDGTFGAGTKYTLPNGIYSAIVADVNGDGTPDLVVETLNGSLSYFPGTAAGFLTIALPIAGAQNGPLGQGGFLIGAAKRSLDGEPFLLTSTPIGISVLLLNGAGGVSSVNGIYNAGPGRTSYAIADLNGDGSPDLAVDSPEGIAILYGRPDGSFQSSYAYAAGQPAYSVALGQFTGSGDLDAVVATGVPQLQLLNGDGLGHFTATNPASPANAAETDGQRFLWSNIVTGDFDGDGKLDAAITLEGRYPPNAGTMPPPDGLSVQFGNGDGTFSAPVLQAPLAGSPHYGYSATGDFAGTGATGLANLDLGFDATYLGGSAARSGNMQRNVLYNDTYVDSSNGANPQLVEPDSYDLIATGYLNPGHTGKQDIVVQDDAAFVVYQNNGDGTFFPGPTAIADNVASFTAPSTFHVQDPVTGLLPSSGVFPGALLLQDIDGDGYGDVAILYHNLASDPAHPSAATPNQLYIYWGQGNRNFNSTPTILTLDRNFYQLHIADVDGDGIPDLILSDGYIIGILHGLGNHTFGNEVHLLGGMGINSLALADINRNGATDIVLANGGLTLSNPVATNGTLALNTDVFTGGITVLPNHIVSHVVTGSVTASPEPSLYGADFTLTATVTPPASGVAATGTVTFSIDGNAVGTAPVSGGSATYDVTAPTIVRGAHSLTAAYSGDTNYNMATFTGSHTIMGLESESFYNNTTPTIYYGQVADGVGAVEAVQTAPGATVNGGDLTFYDGTTNICVLPVNGQSQTCPPSAGAGFQVGNHVITVVYSGNDYYEPSTSAPSTTTVLPDDTSGVVVTNLTPSTFGQPVTFTATFSAPYATPTGTATFYDGATPIGTAPLGSTGAATFITSALIVGTHNITASLAASLDFNGSVTGPVQQVVIPAALQSITLLSSSLNPAPLAAAVTFTATVFTTNNVIPQGSVSFLDGGQTIGTGTLSSGGIAQFTTSTLPLGSHNITATYAASSTVATSTSAILVQQITQPTTTGPNGFTIKVDPTYINVGIGGAVSINVSVIETGGYSQPVKLSCTDLPGEATCGFAEALIPAGGGTTLMALSPAAPHDCGSTTPYFVTPNSSHPGAVLLGACVLIFFARRRRTLKGLVLAAIICILPAISGCGNCTDLGVRPGVYSFNISGTSTGSPSTTVTVPLKMNAHL